MKELENLKELYLEEIKKINRKGELTPADAEAAKKALEAIEKINEICCDEEELNGGYSERGYSNGRYSNGGYSERGYSNRYSNGGYSDRSYGQNGTMSRRMPEMYSDRYSDRYYNDGYSERRGRSSTTGRYISRHNAATADNMIRKLEMMRTEAPDSETMMAIDNVISKLEDY